MEDPKLQCYRLKNRRLSNTKNEATPRATLEALGTEAINPRTAHLDKLPLGALVRTLQREDAAVAPAVKRCTPQISAAVAGIAKRFEAGGRVIYVGAGSSGRLGVLDAAECPPTFGIAAGRVVGVIAGGTGALRHSIEGVEDLPEAARRDLKRLHLTPLDSVVGIAASGRTPYTVAALRLAREQGCLTVALTNVSGSPLAENADIAIEVITGAEALAGSTRMKAGSAQKMVLNLISTALMVRLGRVRGNLMTCLQPSNAKLRARAQRIRRALARPAGK
ncbi:MAG: N-acetylmuramic acid 6-phosphate etherase [Terriglobales bacterium]